jgi:alpha/beta superfamily hydrolase
MKLKIFFFSFLLILSASAYSQSDKKFEGAWRGVLSVGVELRIVVHIKEDSLHNFYSTLDSPDQSAYGIKADETLINGDEITIAIKNLNATLTGHRDNDSTINGTFTQGTSVPLHLTKTDKVTALKRPQTPVPPFAYKTEDIEYDNKSKSLHYGATITIPKGRGPFPSAVLITGSGPQNRDEEIFEHRPFAVIADDLTKNGFVILRVDDRGVGKSTGNFNIATSEDFANDVNVAIDYLKSRPEVDAKRIGLIGHSEGGMIAPMVATQRNDIDYIVLLAAPGIKIDQLMAEQNGAILRSSGISEKASLAFQVIYKEIINQIIHAPDTATARKAAEVSLQNWIAATDVAIIQELKFNDENGQREYIKAITAGLYVPWFRYFLAYDPQPNLQKLNSKVLALNGSKDLQVLSKSNLAGIESSLRKSRSKKFEVKEMEGLNHLFQACNTCTVAEYGQLEETFSPEALRVIREWLEKNVK